MALCESKCITILSKCFWGRIRCFGNLIFIKQIKQKGFEPIVSMMNRVTLQCGINMLNTHLQKWLPFAYFNSKILCLRIRASIQSHNLDLFLKFIYSEKATKFCEISALLLSVCTVDKSKVEISQNFVAFSEYMKFKNNWIYEL